MEPAYEDPKEETQVDIARSLVDNRLDQAQDALAANDLDTAQSHFERAIRVEGEHPYRTARIIRPMLKDYSDRITDQDPPDWENAHRALDLLDSLELQDEDTREWQRDLWLKRADFLLRNQKLDDSFNIFQRLMDKEGSGNESDELKREISRIVRVNLLRQAEQRDDLGLLPQIVERFQPLSPSGDELNEWLETISLTLAARSQAADELREELKREIRRNRSFMIAVVAIIVLAVVAYLVVLVILPSIR